MEYIGLSGSGTFNQEGGSNGGGGSAYNNIILGNNPGSSGTYNLKGGLLYLNYYEQIGFSGTGVFTQSGGTNTTYGLSRNRIYLGQTRGSTGTYNLIDGLLTPHCSENIGYYGTGSCTQSGGTNSVGNSMVSLAQAPAAVEPMT